jgi:hypothetical protein
MNFQGFLGRLSHCSSGWTTTAADITGTDLFQQTWLRTAVAGARYQRYLPICEGWIPRTRCHPA